MSNQKVFSVSVMSELKNVQILEHLNFRVLDWGHSNCLTDLPYPVK